MVKIQFWECEVPLHCHYSQVHSEPKGVVPIKVLSIGPKRSFLKLSELDKNT